MDDLEELRKLKARYFRALDSKDWDLLEEVFAEDLVVDVTAAGGERFEGRSVYMPYVSSLKLIQSVHHGHMPELELLSENMATGVWAMEDFNLWEDGSQTHGYGHYFETYEKKGGRWRIRTLKLRYLRLERWTGEPPLLVAGAANLADLRGPNPARPQG